MASIGLLVSVREIGGEPPHRCTTANHAPRHAPPRTGNRLLWERARARIDSPAITAVHSRTMSRGNLDSHKSIGIATLVAPTKAGASRASSLPQNRAGKHRARCRPCSSCGSALAREKCCQSGLRRLPLVRGLPGHRLPRPVGAHRARTARPAGRYRPSRPSPQTPRRNCRNGRTSPR